MDVELHGRRAALRQLAAGDVEALFRACQDEDTQRYTSIPVPYTRDAAVEFVHVTAPSGWTSGERAVFAISASSGGMCDGTIELRFDGVGGAAVGFAVAPWARRRGVATDALRAICTWGFEQRSLSRIEWEAVVGNWASRRAAERVGFRLEGTCRRRLVLRSERSDSGLAGLLPGDVR